MNTCTILPRYGYSLTLQSKKKKKENVSSLDNYIRTGKVACTF